jgi:hypothetical protein
VPEAAAQAPARPKPQELWRQFPLNDARSKKQAPAQPSSTPRVAPSTPRSPADEGGDGSLPTVQIAAIVLAMGLLLMLTTAVLAYATRGEFGLDSRRLRRLPRGLWPSGAARDAIGRVRYRLDSLVSRFRERAVPADTDTGTEAGPLSALDEALEAYLASRVWERTEDEELELLKAKLAVRAASAGRPADQELEILKAKRGQPGGRVEAERPDEVETLKAKLAGKDAREDQTTTQNELEAKSVERGATAANRPRRQPASSRTSNASRWPTGREGGRDGSRHR